MLAVTEREWYKDAIIYQLHVRSFFDSNGDGVGDFPGLTQKLDYIASLGATAIWLLPFYPSPLRDEGYDIADYTNVHPTYGTLDDFVALLTEAHARGLRVITELVINHTSDQHPWFQRARRAPKGSRFREYYVWSDTPDRYAAVRVIFQDFENSNWTWDPVAQQYFWHRFYYHQPDLNFDNEEVQNEILAIVDFWLRLGVDGMRLDAIPYLYEREGTHSESLPETHGFLRQLRQHVDERFPGRMLLAEANQWPDETAAFFGAGDECHMCFHFPLMPRLFLAVQEEDRFPIVDVLRQTPAPPESCQWAIFLRNHDELTLEMVTEEERLLMYRAYAADPQSRVNLGVRRRLAPLLKNDRRKLELLHALLLSLPGTPVFYYGDEIGMGDNIYLRDRDSVRTPMQWAGDRNAGFSRANPQQLFLPPIIDPEFHYQTRNVETQESSPHSLLWWLRRVIPLRRRHPAFSRGSLEFLMPANPRILAFLRRYGDEVLLVVVNLSRLAQFVELDLSEFRGRAPQELFGQTRFPMIGELPYLLTVGPHGFYWFRLEWPVGQAQRRTPGDLPELRAALSWTEVFDLPGRQQLEAVLPDHIAEQHWFMSPQRHIRGVAIQEAIPLSCVDAAGATYAVLQVRVDFSAGESDTYSLFLLGATAQRAEYILNDRPSAGIAKVTLANDGPVYLCDATAERDFWRILLARMPAPALTTGMPRIAWRAADPEPIALSPDPAAIVPLVRHTPGRSALAAIENRILVKLFRRIEPGIHPEEEIGRAARRLEIDLRLPRLYGALQIVSAARRDPMVLGVLQQYEPHEETLAELFARDLDRQWEEVRACLPPEDPNAPERPQLVDFISTELASRQTGDGMLQRSELLGLRLAEIHRALSSVADDPGIAAEPFSAHYRRSVFEGTRTLLARTLERLRQSIAFHRLPGLDPVAVRALFEAEPRLRETIAAMLEIPIGLRRIRCHGRLRLDKVLWTGNDVRFLDWEGDPERPLSERRLKRCGLRDVAGLVYSLHQIAMRWEHGRSADAMPHALAAVRWRRLWYQLHAARMVHGYTSAAEGAGLVPPSAELPGRLVDCYLVHTALTDMDKSLQESSADAVAAALALLIEVVDRISRSS